MTRFDRKFFRPYKFDKIQIARYLKNAVRDLDIARKDAFPEVKFTYSDQTLIKAGIVLLAKVGGVRVRSVPGHHAKILEKMREVLNDEDVLAIGDAMRKKVEQNIV